MGLTSLQEGSQQRCSASPLGGSASVHGILEPLHGQTVVIKYGGAALEKPDLRNLFSRDIALARTLGVAPVVVHGGRLPDRSDDEAARKEPPLHRGPPRHGR